MKNYRDQIVELAEEIPSYQDQIVELAEGIPIHAWLLAGDSIQYIFNSEEMITVYESGKIEFSCHYGSLSVFDRCAAESLCLAAARYRREQAIEKLNETLKGVRQWPK